MTEQQIREIQLALRSIMSQLSSMESESTDIDVGAIADAVVEALPEQEPIDIGDQLAEAVAAVEAPAIDVSSIVSKLNDLEAEVDLSPVLQKLQLLEDREQPSLDLSSVLEAVAAKPVADLSEVKAELEQIQAKLQPTDLSPLLQAIDSIQPTDLSSVEAKLDEVAKPQQVDLSSVEFKLQSLLEAPSIDLSPLITLVETRSAQILAKLDKADITPVINALQQMDYKLFSVQDDEFESLAEKLGAMKAELDELEALPNTAPTEPELGEFEVVTPTLTVFGGASNRSGTVNPGSLWASGFYSEKLLQHPGEYAELIIDGFGFFGIKDPVEPTNVYDSVAGMFFSPEREAGNFSAVSLRSGLMKGLQAEAGKPVRITLLKDRIQWAVVDGNLVKPQFEFPLYGRGLAVWGVLGSRATEVSDIKLGLFTNQ